MVEAPDDSNLFFLIAFFFHTLLISPLLFLSLPFLLFFLNFSLSLFTRVSLLFSFHSLSLYPVITFPLLYSRVTFPIYLTLISLAISTFNLTSNSPLLLSFLLLSFPHSFLHSPSLSFTGLFASFPLSLSKKSVHQT